LPVALPPLGVHAPRRDGAFESRALPPSFPAVEKGSQVWLEGVESTWSPQMPSTKVVTVAVVHGMSHEHAEQLCASFDDSKTTCLVP